MDQKKLRQYASNLCVKLTKLAKSDDNNSDYAAGALHDLIPLFKKVDKGEITEPPAWDDVPCNGLFHPDAPLGQIEDLDNSYSSFKVEITGGGSEDLRKFIREAQAQAREENKRED